MSSGNLRSMAAPSCLSSTALLNMPGWRHWKHCAWRGALRSTARRVPFIFCSPAASSAHSRQALCPHASPSGMYIGSMHTGHIMSSSAMSHGSGVSSPLATGLPGVPGGVATAGEPLPLPLPLPTVSVWSASRKVKPAAPQPPAQVSAATAEDGRRNTARVPVGAVVGVAPRWRAAQAARAEWVAASDTTTSRRYDPPCRDLSCWGVPRQARQPPAMMPTLEHSTSTSSMLWVVSTTATPEASVADRMAPHIARRAPGSMPLLGSSRSTAWGMPAKAIARLSLRLLPPE
mmetsp:Transcript_7891/g.23250  ORF Transcript_7891/g.23250 Transcript_7891/m.23250 type:complete len:289 (-) Transcript_7891:6675-7541(-)